MENMETTVTTWTEVLKNYKSVKDYLITRMKNVYLFSEEESSVIFEVDNDTKMKIVELTGKDENSFVMNYYSSDDEDDGDQYYISEYDTPDELFNAMLEETQR
jgi:hypothetical protein